MKKIIHQARVLNPSTHEDQIADVLIEDKRIVAIESSIEEKEAEKIDAKGKWLFPGVVDLHTHLREPGNVSQETIASGTHAAAAGGVTSVVCMADTNPPIDNKSTVEFVLDTAHLGGVVKVYPVGALTKNMEGLEMAPLGDMVQSGIVAVSDDSRGVMNSYVMRRVMEYSTIFDIPIISHAEDHTLTEGASVHEGAMSFITGMFGWPREAETIQVARDLLLAKKTGAHVHVAHVSASDTVDLIRFYKSKGVRVTAETAPHYLVLTDKAVDHFNTNAKVCPPLREEEDQQALYEGLRDGTIDCIATDHSPITSIEKEKEFPLAPFGIVGLETMLPLLLGRIQERLGMELLDLLALITCNPAKIMNLSAGGLQVGEIADLTLWDPAPTVVIDREKFYSKSSNTPFHGWEIQGRVDTTFVNGNLVYTHENGIVPHQVNMP